MIAKSVTGRVTVLAPGLGIAGLFLPPFPFAGSVVTVGALLAGRPLVRQAARLMDGRH